MRFPCRYYEECENFKQDACEGCRELERYPKWFIEVGGIIAKMILEAET